MCSGTIGCIAVRRRLPAGAWQLPGSSLKHNRDENDTIARRTVRTVYRMPPQVPPPAARHILVVDAVAESVATTAQALAAARYRVSTVATADETRRVTRRERFDLILLSAWLPGLPVGRLLRELRAWPPNAPFGTPTDSVGIVVIVAAEEGDQERARCRALEEGADDVLASPFSTPELLLRVAAVLRRVPVASSDAAGAFRLGTLTVDFAGHQVMVDDAHVDLTRRDFELLRVLTDNAGRVCTREQLGGSHDLRLWSPADRTIDMQISRLRRKLGSAGEMIENVRGEGYRLRTGGRSRRP